MINGQFQFRRDTAANWTSANPTLASGELGLETDTQKFKIGTGSTPWNTLPYGGIKGDTGASGATGATGAAGTNGWSPILANVTDGERRVLRLVDWTGGTGTKPAVPTDNYIGSAGFTNLAGATDIRGATGAQGATGAAGATPNSFTNIAVSGQTTVSADQAADTLTLVAGTGITLTTDAANDSVTINNTDTGSAARTAHEAAADPHPQYATDAQISNVRNPVSPNIHTTAPQTLNQTLTAAATMTIPANSLVAGDAFEIDVLFGTLVNTTAASNLEVAVFVNGAQNAIALAAMGTTAVAAPGRGGRALFKIVFRTVGAAGTALANGTIHVNNLANFASNQVAAQTVNTTAAVTLDVRVRTSAATTTGTVQFAAIDQAT